MIHLSNINKFVIVRIKIFTLKDLWLFLIGILFVSATSGAIGAFMLGVADEEFFIGEAENILIVSQPESTTPLTGKVPEYLQNDIQKVSGVMGTSPETLCFSIAQNLKTKAVIVRGITPNFTKLTPINLIDGSWFDPIFGETNEVHTDGAVIGSILAEEMEVSCGDTIQFASTLVDAVIEVVITGIVYSGTPSDEGLLVPLSIGKILAGCSVSQVSFIRVMVDNDIISKEELSELLSSEFEVPIFLSSQDPDLISKINEIPIIAYTPSGTHVETQTMRNNSKVVFRLKFGTYEFISTPSGVQNSLILSIFVNQSFKTPFEIKVGAEFYDLSLNITYNNYPADNASVLIQEKFQPENFYSNYTNSEGIINFSCIPENFYIIIVNNDKIERNITIRLNHTMYLEIELVSSLTLKIINITSNHEVQGGRISIEDTSFQDEEYLSGTQIFLDPQEYKIEFELNGVTRKFNVRVEEQENVTIYVGKTYLYIWVRMDNETGLENSSAIIVKDGQIVSQNSTGSDGFCSFQLEVGFDYNIATIPGNNQTRIFNRKFYFQKSSTIYIDFLDSYQLDVLVLNGTLGNISGNEVVECNVTVFKDGIPVISELTNNSGMVSFIFSEPGIYRLIATKNGYRWDKSFGIYSKETNYNVKLGLVSLIVSTQSIIGNPIEGAKISVIDGDTIIAFSVTNQQGLATLYFPEGKYILEVLFRNFVSERNITYEISQKAFLVEIIELNGNLTLTLANQFKQIVKKAYFVLFNEYYDLEFTGFTDVNGDISFYNMPWGSYTLEVKFNEDDYFLGIIEIHDFVVSFPVTIETPNPIIDIDDFNWKDSGTFSVILSSEYISGFLETSLEIIITTLTSLIIIISILSLLSIASVISNPIVSNEKTLNTFKLLGASKNQVIIGVVVHLTLMGIVASLIGSLLGMIVMINIPMLKNMSVGGIIINPKIDIFLLLIISLSNLVVIITKSMQKVNQLYNIRRIS